MTDGNAFTLPLFPLTNVVLFPTVSVPLYVFEPRYRQMTRDALAGDRRIGMVAVRREFQDRMEGDPPIFETGCEGVISHAEERPDGTWSLLLSATKRFRILREAPRDGTKLYRTAQVIGLDDSPADPEVFRLLRGEVEDRLEDLLRPTLDPEELPNALATIHGLANEQFANALAQMLDFDVLEKQRLLESAGQQDRTITLRDLLDFRLAETRILGANRNTRVH
jgi:Lon protease-like protein